MGTANSQCSLIAIAVSGRIVLGAISFYLWDQLEFSSHFEKIFYSANIGYPKKNPKFFATINVELGIHELPEAPLFFDDSEAVVNASREAGWEGVIFNSVDDFLHHPRISNLL